MRRVESSLLRFELFFCPIFVEVLYHGVETEILLFVHSRNRDIDFRIRRQWSGNPRIPVEAVSECFIHPTRVGDIVVKVELGASPQMTAFDTIVEIDFEGFFDRSLRLHERTVTFVTYGNVRN